jgi:type IV fimbrial biogenesis protein FimT
MERTRSEQRGFTVTELLVTLAIMAVVLAIAVPSFRDSSVGGQLRSASNNFVASARFARSEAIKRNTSVTLCVSSDGETCGTGGWQQGWIVVSGGTVLKAQSGAPVGYRITEAAGQTSLTFPPWGAGATPATLTACRKTPSPARQERVITIDASGRATVKRTTTGTCS